jgi:hypothetical protein
MHNKPLIILGIILGAISVVLGIYAPTLIFTQTPTPEQPSHPGEYREALNFQLSTDTTPGNTDEYDSHSFSIYLERGQELYLSFYAEGAAVMLRVTTPTERHEDRLGYQTSTGSAGNVKDKGLGHLEKGKVSAAAEGHFNLIALEEGSYVIDVKSSTPQGEIDVLIEYQIT